MEKIFTLLILFQLKHFLADFPLQGRYMLGKFKEKGWVTPLAAHAAVHMLFTVAIANYFTSITLAIALGILDFVVHFTMDRIKASPHMLGRYKPDQKEFWWALGIDQMVHHLTHYYIIFVILKGTFA